MLIVTGSARARPATLEQALALSLAHVRRSRTEPGCLLHSVHQDVEDPNRLVFLEHWADRDALAAHFALPAALEFVTELADLVEGPPALHVFEAEPTRI